jgi:hypothetical protein
MKTKFILPLITMVATSVFGAPGAGAAISGGGAARTAPAQTAPAQNAPGGPAPGVPGGLNNPAQTQNPNQNGQQPDVSPNAGVTETNFLGQPGSPATSPQNFVTNSLTGQNTNQAGGMIGNQFNQQPQTINRSPNNFNAPPR